MFQRPHIKELTSRILEPRKHIQVVMGPRQVGKTTLVNQITKQINIPSYFVSADAVAF
nr:AAA family ATPase [Pedobacter panaciterrae]